MIEAKTLKAGSFQTAYLEGGNPSSQSIVFLHDGGFGTTSELCWGPVMEILSDRYHVVAVDLLGWGGSDKAVFLDRSPYPGRIAHVADFIQALGLKDQVLVGASFGGSLVMRAICESGNPLGASAAISFSGTGGPYRLRLEDLADYTPNVEEATRLTEMLVTSLDGLDEHIQKRYENSLIPGHWESLMAPRLKNPSVDRVLPADPYAEQLQALTVPTLLVEGRHDSLLETGWAAKLAELNPIISRTITEYSHEPNIEAPAYAAGIIADFIAAQEGSHA